MSKAKVFMKLSKEVSKGLSKAKNAPARKYPKNPKVKAPTPAKGLPDKGMMGAKAQKQLNKGAQAAKDLAAARKAATSKEMTVIAKGKGMAVIPKGKGIATIPKGTGMTTVSKGRGIAVIPKTIGTAAKVSAVPKNVASGLTLPQKVVGGTALAIGGTAAIMINDKKSTPKPKAFAPRGIPAAGPTKGRQAPASAVSRGGSRAVNKPAPMKSTGMPTKPAGSKGFSIPATPMASKPAAPTAAVKDLSMSISMPSAPLSPAKAQKPDKQIGGLLGRTDGKWHLRRKAGRG